MTPEALIAALAPSRLPAAMRSLEGAEILALFGLGLVLAAILGLLVTPLLSRRRSVRQRIQATRGLPVDERLLAIARLRGSLPDALRAGAYAPAPSLTDQQIERAALDEARRG